MSIAYRHPFKSPKGKDNMITYEVQVEEHTDHTLGRETWLLNGKKHRDGDLPAVTYNGDQFWYKHGNLHRTNGPAVVYADGKKVWYLDGKKYLRAEDHAFALNPHKELTIAEIEEKLGYKIKVIK